MAWRSLLCSAGHTPRTAPASKHFVGSQFAHGLDHFDQLRACSFTQAIPVGATLGLVVVAASTLAASVVAAGRRAPPVGKAYT